MSLANPTFASSGPGTQPGVNDAPGTPLTADKPPSATAEMMTRVVNGAHETIDDLAQRATPPLEHLAQGLSDTGEALHDKAELWRAAGDEWAESLRCTVREHPLAALAAALAVGVAIARLTR